MLITPVFPSANVSGRQAALKKSDCGQTMALWTRYVSDPHTILRSEYAPFAWSLYHNQSQAKHEGQDDILVEHGSQLFFGGHCGRLVMLKSKPESVPDKFEKRVDGDNLGFHSLTLKRDSRTFFTGGAPIPSAVARRQTQSRSIQWLVASHMPVLL